MNNKLRKHIIQLKFLISGVGFVIIGYQYLILYNLRNQPSDLDIFVILALIGAICLLISTIYNRLLIDE